MVAKESESGVHEGFIARTSNTNDVHWHVRNDGRIEHRAFEFECEKEKVLQKKALKLMHRGSIGQQPRKVHNREVRNDILENNKSEPRR